MSGSAASTESGVGSVDVGLRPLLVDAKKAAGLLGIGRTTLYELINAGAITPVHIGRCVRFPVAELERFVADGCTVQGRPRQLPEPDQASTRPRSARRATSGGAALRLFDPAS